VLKDGQFVTTLENTNRSKDELAALMVGGRLLTKRPSRKEVTMTREDVLLSLKNLTRTGAFEKISFDLHKGEILGIGGITGCGKAELARVIFGDLKPNSGEITIMNSLVKRGTIRDAISSGIAYVPKNRDKEGLILRASIRQNISLPILRRLSIFGWLNLRREKELTQQLITNLRIKCKNSEDQIISLSGGNRQKVVLAKWLAEQASIYVLDNPTRGVDVGAKQEIYQLIEKLADQGAAILLVSDEMPELLNLSDTIIILRRGHISQSFSRGSFPTEQTLINHMI
jgi:ABC-type sugar transport system ATPase subunit